MTGYDLRPFSEGIGVRASVNKMGLWFHMEPQSQDVISAAMHAAGGAFTRGSVDSIGRGPEGLRIDSMFELLEYVLPRGMRVFSNLVWLDGVKWISSHPNYFDILTPDKTGAVWHQLLPRVIGLLRVEFGLPGLPVYPVRQPTVPRCDWHEGLLTELFGSDGTGTGF